MEVSTYAFNLIFDQNQQLEKCTQFFPPIFFQNIVRWWLCILTAPPPHLNARGGVLCSSSSVRTEWVDRHINTQSVGTNAKRLFYLLLTSRVQWLQFGWQGASGKRSRRRRRRHRKVCKFGYNLFTAFSEQTKLQQIMVEGFCCVWRTEMSIG